MTIGIKRRKRHVRSAEAAEVCCRQGGRKWAHCRQMELSGHPSRPATEQNFRLQSLCQLLVSPCYAWSSLPPSLSSSFPDNIIECNRVSGAVSASFWSLASSGISNGLTPGEAIGAMVVGAVMVALVAQACGAPGLKYHLGFPMMSRATFGMYGSYLVVLVKCFTTFI